MFLDPTGFDQQHYVFSLCAPRVSGHGAHLGLRRASQGRCTAWAASTAASGLRIEDGNVVRFNGTYTGPTDEDSSKYYFHFDSWRMNVQPGIWLPVAVYVEETQRIEGRQDRRPEGADALLGLLAQAAHARQRERQREGGRRRRQERRLAGCGPAAGLAHVGHAG